MRCVNGKKRAAKRLVSIEQLTGSGDSFGEVDQTLDANWSQYISRRGRIITRGGSEGYRFGRVSPRVNLIIEVASDSQTRAITSDMRVAYGQKRYDIEAAYDVDEERRTVLLACVENI